LKFWPIKIFTEEEWKKIVVNSGEVKLLRALKEKLPPIQRSIEGKWGGEPLTQLEYYFAEVRDSYEFLSLNVGLRLGDEPLYCIIGKRKRFEERLKVIQGFGVPIIGWDR
jgi:hypothetical protein